MTTRRLPTLDEQTRKKLPPRLPRVGSCKKSLHTRRLRNARKTRSPLANNDWGWRRRRQARRDLQQLLIPSSWVVGGLLWKVTSRRITTDDSAQYSQTICYLVARLHRPADFFPPILRHSVSPVKTTSEHSDLPNRHITCEN